MPISLKVARTAEDRDRVFRLRHEVLSQESKKFIDPSERIFDRYDAFEESVNILATEGDSAVATIRVTMETPAGMPALDHYDFYPLMSTLDGKFASMGWLCVSKGYRKHWGLVHGLFKMIFREMRKRGTRHLIGPIQRNTLFAVKKLGAKQVADETVSEPLNMSVFPIHFDIKRLEPGAKEASQDPLHMIFSESNERRIYSRGEVIVKKGEPGTEAYLIMRGSVKVFTTAPGENNCGTARTGPMSPSTREGFLGMGQIFGELSLLDGGPRTSTVICHSKEVDLMVWTHEEFLRQLQTDRHKAFEICRILGSRFRKQIEGPNGIKPLESLIAGILVDASRDGQEMVDFKWLAGQCGLGVKQMKPVVSSWTEKSLIALDNLDGSRSIRILDLDALKSRIV